ncbi:MAG: D-alanyl-D-alanine carboxypeptidase family protein [Rhodocyclaceae bacterium]
MRFLLIAFALLLGLPAHAEPAPQPPAVAARAWLLLDWNTGQVLAAESPDTRIEPASLTKLMTAYLTFAALRQKTLSLNQVIPVSEKAWKTSGSRMFIDLKQPVTVDELLHGMIIQSGNDACVALAEAIGGSEEGFALMMNREAQRMGLKNTHFVNATGLADPQHYTTARDLATLAGILIRDFPDFYPIYSKKNYTYNKISQPNRNRLLWTDPTVDGVKTGHTEAAGYCLIASAKRGPRRLLSVVLGAASEGVRAQESQKLLNYGFQFYDTVVLYKKGDPVRELRVWKGKQNIVKAGFAEDLQVSIPKGEAPNLKVELTSRQPLLAPIAQGSQLGTLKLFLGDKPLGEYAVGALEEVPAAGFAGRTWDAMRLWIQ